MYLLLVFKILPVAPFSTDKNISFFFATASSLDGLPGLLTFKLSITSSTSFVLLGSVSISCLSSVVLVGVAVLIKWCIVVAQGSLCSGSLVLARLARFLIVDDLVGLDVDGF